jgi:hypothetical protein
MCEMQDFIPDIKSITMSGRGYVDAIGISFPSIIENSTMDLPLEFVLAIAGIENSVVVQQVLGCGFTDGIMLFDFHVVQELIHVKVYTFIFGVLEGVIHINWVQELYNC